MNLLTARHRSSPIVIGRQLGADDLQTCCHPRHRDVTAARASFASRAAERTVARTGLPVRNSADRPTSCVPT